MSYTLYTPDTALDTIPEGLSLIRRSEGFRSYWYQDVVGVWTIGYGTTLSALPGLTRADIEEPISEATGNDLLLRTLMGQYEVFVETLTKVPLTAPQFAALVSFVYNVGSEAYRSSTLLRLLNRKQYQDAAAQFSRWVYADGKVYNGLVRRREAERRLFLSETTDTSYVIDGLDRLQPAPIHRVESGRPPLRRLVARLPYPASWLPILKG